MKYHLQSHLQGAIARSIAILLSYIRQQESQGHPDSSDRRTLFVWLIVWGQLSTQPTIHTQRLMNIDWRHLSHTKCLHLSLCSTGTMPCAHNPFAQRCRYTQTSVDALSRTLNPRGFSASAQAAISPFSQGRAGTASPELQLYQREGKASSGTAGFLRRMWAAAADAFLCLTVGSHTALYSVSVAV